MRTPFFSLFSRLQTSLQSIFARDGKIRSTWRVLSPAQRYTSTIIILIFLALLFTLIVQYYNSHTTIVPSYAGTYREGIVSPSPRLINPVLASDNDAEKTIAHIIYPSLLSYDGSGKLVPSLAQSYAVDGTGKHYRFVLKNNLTWDDGASLSAADVVFTVTLVQDASYNSPLRANWLGIKATQDGDNAVSFDLPAPYAPFLQNTTMGILPKHIWANVPASSFALAEANIKPVGAGPYRFDALQKDVAGAVLSYNLARNDRYAGPKPFFDGVNFYFFHNENEALHAYQNKTIDGMGLVSATDLARVQSMEQARSIDFNVPRYFAIFLNPSQGPALQDPSVRQALAYATDKQALVRDVLDGHGQPIQGPILPFMDAYNAQQKMYAFNVGQANDLLDGDKWLAPDGGDGVRQKSLGPSLSSGQASRGKKAAPSNQTVRLEFTLATADAPELVQTAQELQKQWQKIGVKLNIQTYSLSDLQQNAIAGRHYQMLLFGQFLSLDPDPFAFWDSSQTSAPGLNLALYNNKDADKLLENARGEMDQTKRIQDLQAFQEKVANDLPAIFLYRPSFVYLAQKNTKGIEGAILADPSWRLAHIGSWYIDTQRTWK